MSAKANPKVIGGFVVGAAILITAAILLFGSGDFFVEKMKYVLHFEGSLKGLSTGSPVLFRGVPLGEVSAVVLRFNTDTNEDAQLVYIELNPANVEITGSRDLQSGQGLQYLVDERGLRAQLVTQSMITGQRVVQLDYFPGLPKRITGLDPTTPELPTVPSIEEQVGSIFESLKDMPIVDLVENLNGAVTEVREVIKELEVEKISSDLREMLTQFNKLAAEIGEQIGPLSTSAIGALDQARGSISSVEGKLNSTLDDIQHLAKNIDNTVDTTLEETLSAARDALRQAKSALAKAEGVISQDSPTIYGLNEALTELTAALRSIRALADYLERHPEAVIQGKNPSGGS